MKCCEIMIYFLCAILLVLACALCSGGLYLAVGFKHMNDNILPKFDDAKANIRKMIATINQYDPRISIDDPPNVNPFKEIHFDRIVNGLGYYILVLSSIMLMLGITIITGTCKKSNYLWKAGIIVIAVLLVTETITLLLGTSFRESVKDLLKANFREQLNSFQSIRSKDPVSIGWNLVMQKFNCCGIDGYFDFNGSSSFTETWGQPIHTFIQYNPFQTALACCNTIYIQTSIGEFGGPCYDVDYLTKQGCMDVLWNVVEGYKVFFIAIIVFIMIIQVSITILIFAKLHTRKNSNRIGIVSKRLKNCHLQNIEVKGHDKKDKIDKTGDYMNNKANIGQEKQYWNDGMSKDPSDIEESDFNEDNMHGGFSATHMKKDKSWLQDFNWHLQTSEQNTHYIKENSWLQDFKNQLQGLDQGTRIDDDEFDLKKEKWYRGTRNPPMQRTRRT